MLANVVGILVLHLREETSQLSVSCRQQHQRPVRGQRTKV